GGVTLDGVVVTTNRRQPAPRSVGRLRTGRRRAPDVRSRRSRDPYHDEGVRPAEGLRGAPEPGAVARPSADADAQSRVGALRPLDLHPERPATPQDRVRPGKPAGDPARWRRRLNVLAGGRVTGA